ncbi:bifunctional (p)ppGpp synthetase/guanosine-3',5'-bis(diphosphate) 3'-pyrophosphohydrolase [Candidatus Woesearchaeota archaeon]|nr:bifunctional (p)ppGpp synthetase/guanosine-3',5'-bis(diphosphate) 3'-pyrophosphohydrolase [Candidatus Woesearchaeota archaeon]
MTFKDLVKKILKYNKNSDANLIEKAYLHSQTFLKNKYSEEEFKLWIKHYLDVTEEVVNLKLDDVSIAASLMHGLLFNGEDIKNIRRDFGNEIADIVENVHKMDQISHNISKKEIKIENLRKVLLAASRDLRALFIILVDKLIVLRELSIMPDNERKRLARDGIEVYAPLAYRLGMGKLKSEIEDLSFKYLDEAKYKVIEDKVDKIRKSGERALFRIKKDIKRALDQESIKATIQARVKHLYSIYKKIIEKSSSLNDMTDIIAFRVIVQDIDDCYKSLRIVHENFRPVSNRFKDYIAMPKPNGYQSLHTTVVDKEGKIFEIQIRTEEMHNIAEEGVAAHFIYKKVNHEETFDRRLSWLKQLIENKDSLGNFDVDFFGEEIYAFTPKGDVFELPKESTVIDFAYRVHSDLGDKCIGAHINGKFASIRDTVKNGDVIEILTSKTQSPSREWLKFIKSSKAKEKIRHALKEAGKLFGGIYYVKENSKKDIGETLLVFEGEKNLVPKLALCCKPLPGDLVIGVKISNKRLMVHRVDCKGIFKTTKKKVKINWVENFDRPVGITIEAVDRPGLLKEVTNALVRLNLKTEKSKGRMINDNDIEYSFNADVKNLDNLNDLIFRIKKIKDVKKVYVKLV